MKLSPELLQRAILVGLLGLVAIGYSNTLRSPFYLDDRPHIKDNPLLRASEITPQGIVGALLAMPTPTRPVTNLSFYLNFRIAGQEVASYHVVNIILHVLCTGAVFLFLSTFLGIFNDKNHPARLGQEVIPLAAIVLWSVNPVQTQAVTYIVQRSILLATLFITLGLYARIKAMVSIKKTSWMIVSITCYLLALGSKEISAGYPLLVGLTLLAAGGQVRSKKWLLLEITGWAVPAFGLAILVMGGEIERFMKLTWWFMTADHFPFQDFGGMDRVRTEFKVLLYYISLFFAPLPWRLSFMHETDVFHSWLAPGFMVSFAIITGILVAALRLQDLGTLILELHFA